MSATPVVWSSRTCYAADRWLASRSHSRRHSTVANYRRFSLAIYLSVSVVYATVLFCPSCVMTSSEDVLTSSWCVMTPSLWSAVQHSTILTTGFVTYVVVGFVTIEWIMSSKWFTVFSRFDSGQMGVGNMRKFCMRNAENNMRNDFNPNHSPKPNPNANPHQDSAASITFCILHITEPITITDRWL